MALKRKVIRAYVRNLLLAATQTAAGDNIFNSRMGIIRRADLPAADQPFVNIFVVDELRNEGTGYHQHHQTKEGTLELHIGVYPGPETNIADTLDDLCEEVMSKLDSDRKLGGAVTLCEYQETNIEFNPNAEVPHAVARLAYELQYLES